MFIGGTCKPISAYYVMITNGLNTWGEMKLDALKMAFGEIYFQCWPHFASVVGWFHPLSTHWQHCQRYWQHWHWHHLSRASRTTVDWEWLGVGHLVGIAQNAWTSFRDKDGNGRAM